MTCLILFNIVNFSSFGLSAKRYRKDCRAIDTRANDNWSLSERLDVYLEGNASPGLCVQAQWLCPPRMFNKNLSSLFFLSLPFFY